MNQSNIILPGVHEGMERQLAMAGEMQRRVDEMHFTTAREIYVRLVMRAVESVEPDLVKHSSGLSKDDLDAMARDAATCAAALLEVYGIRAKTKPQPIPPENDFRKTMLDDLEPQTQSGEATKEYVDQDPDPGF